jgi:hypothetical protein
MAGYGAELEDVRRRDPRAKDLVAHMAMIATIANLQRAAAELRKDSSEKEYAARMTAGKAGPWKAASFELDSIARTIGPDMGASARLVQSARVFDAPESL